MTPRPETCPNCGGTDYTLNPPERYDRMCYIGTLHDRFGAWRFYHE